MTASHPLSNLLHTRIPAVSWDWWESFPALAFKALQCRAVLPGLPRARVLGVVPPRARPSLTPDAPDSAGAA